ncbi:MAG: NAD(P)H-binding protein [Candidatus Dormibacteraeota bacterium]|nr:NAD(P)H-binding protein [Candidatus Dormibacteraeota bacterium]
MILVTGATGFIGGNVVAALAEAGTPVRALVRNAARASQPAGVEVVEGDLTQPATLPAAVAGVATVVHAAAITASLKEPYRDAYDLINRAGTENLVAAAATAKVSRLVVMSGLGTKPAPAATYMATRWGLEEAVRSGSVPYVILQPSVLFGAGAEFVSALAGVVRRFPLVPMVGGPELRFQPLWIEDLTRCLVAATADDGLVGRAIALGGAEQLDQRALLEAIAEALGVHRRFVSLPLSLARIQAGLMSAVLPRPPLTPASMELFDFDNVAEPDSVERTFGFKPRGFREHLRAHGLET